MGKSRRTSGRIKIKLRTDITDIIDDKGYEDGTLLGSQKEESSIMGKTLYLECYSGISGDMTVAALLDLGADEEVLLAGLESLDLPGYQVEIERVSKCGIDACDFNVILGDDDSIEEELPEELLEDLEGLEEDLPDEEVEESEESEEPEESHHHDDHHHHDHDHHDHHHSHSHSDADCHHDHGTHTHRGIREIESIIAHSGISDRAKELSNKIFAILAEAESKAHGIPVEDVHFHEVGAVDSIVDIVSAAICLDNLGVESVIVPKLYEGQGYVHCQHGAMPVPVPAVVNIAQQHALRLQITDNQGEMVTPTGAAIVAAIRTSDTLPKDYLISKVGIGAGKRNYSQANILRAFLIQE